MAVSDAHVFPGFLTPVLTELFFPKLPTTFLSCFCRGERQKYTGKKVRLNRESNSQPPCHESGMLITEPPGWGWVIKSPDCLVKGYYITLIGKKGKKKTILGKGENAASNVFKCPHHGY